MTAMLPRAVMALALCCWSSGRGEWAAATRTEFETAVAEEDSLRFALGCLAAAWRDMLTTHEGHYTITSYGLALCLMVPAAAVQIGCALLDLPYLYPGNDGLPGALLAGRSHLDLIRGTYQTGVPVFALILLVIGAGQLRMAWAMLDRDWGCVARMSALMFSATITLILFMAAFHLDSSRALLLAAVLIVELGAIAILVRWHEGLPAHDPGERLSRF